MEQFIVFINNNQKFAVYVSRIHKIIEFQQPKRLPDSSKYFLGVIKYNESILPVIDLSKRLYNIVTEQTVDTKIIVVSWKDKEIGLVVDDIIGIRNFTEEQFEDAKLDVDIANEYISGFIKSEEDIIVNLDIDKIFNKEQEKEISSISD